MGLLSLPTPRHHLRAFNRILEQIMPSFPFILTRLGLGNGETDRSEAIQLRQFLGYLITLPRLKQLHASKAIYPLLLLTVELLHWLR